MKSKGKQNENEFESSRINSPERRHAPHSTLPGDGSALALLRNHESKVSADRKMSKQETLTRKSDVVHQTPAPQAFDAYNQRLFDANSSESESIQNERSKGKYSVRYRGIK